MKIKKVKTPLRTELEIRRMLENCIDRKASWKKRFHGSKLPLKDNAEAIRNYTALRGVVKALEWALGNEEEPLR